jgi:serine/threonine protein kinase
MALASGARLGPYEILSPLGNGGMGEVYQARDTKLNRDVALKILPDAFASDPDRLARFTREAQTLAGLNHPFSHRNSVRLVSHRFLRREADHSRLSLFHKPAVESSHLLTVCSGSPAPASIPAASEVFAPRRRAEPIPGHRVFAPGSNNES